MPVSTARPKAKAKTKSAHRVACHRPAQKRRRWRHDELIAVDLFSGFGGLTEGIRRAGFTTIMAANHNQYKILVHEANHPYAEHWIANLVDPDSADYHSAADLPAADLLVAGISCTNHSSANTKKAYEQGLTLFDLDTDEEYEERVTKSERDRATALCVLQYAAKNRPLMMLIECTTELTAWGPLIPGKKIGDGTTYRWWRKEIAKLGYKSKVLYLNSQFFGVSQSRDRFYLVCWDEKMPDPDLEHRPLSFCSSCDDVVEAMWTWKTGIPASGVVRYGQQYNYRCPRCRREVIPPMAPAIGSIDLSDLGKRIGDRDKPLASSTMSRAQRCVDLFPEFPAVQVPSSMLPPGHPWLAGDGAQLTSTAATMVAAGNTFERPGSTCRTRDLSQPLWTQPATNTVGVVAPPVALTTAHEQAMVVAAVDNYQGAPRGLADPLATQGGSETMALVTAGVTPLRQGGIAHGVDRPMHSVTASETIGLVSAGVFPFRKHTVPSMGTQPMATITSEQNPGLITAVGVVKNNGDDAQAKYRAHPATDPFGTIVSSGGQALVSAGVAAQMQAVWRDVMRMIRVEDCHFRMLKDYEVGRACGFDVDFPGYGYQGTFKVWGTAKQKIDGYGNAVSPEVGRWIGQRLQDVLMTY